MPFARAVIDLIEDMKRSAKGMPELPAEVPTALQSFQGWPGVDQVGEWHFAEFHHMFNYLRGNRKLSIPCEWRGVIPDRLE